MRRMSDQKRESLAAFNAEQKDWYTARRGGPVLKGSLAEIKKAQDVKARSEHK